MVTIYFLTENILSSIVRLRQREERRREKTREGKNTYGSRHQGKWEDGEKKTGKNSKDSEGERRRRRKWLRQRGRE